MKWLLLSAVLVSCGADAATPSATPQIVYVTLPVTPTPQPTLPTFSMWNAPLTLRGGTYATLGLPDTFTAHIQLTATNPVRARILTFEQFAELLNTGSTRVAGDMGATFDITFHDAEGCAAYLLLIEAKEDTTVTPNVMITRNVNPTLTGACAP